MSYKTLDLSVDEGIALLTLNRPEKLNAFNADMAKELVQVFEDMQNMPEAKVVIVTGAGRGFCAGADLSSGGDTFNRKTEKDEVRRDGGGVVTLKIFDFPKPVICAINGPAVGIGVTMQLPMDIRIASDKARFGFVFNRRGINPEAASSWFLPRLVGISKALEWCYTGRVFDAQEALEGGLVSEVVPHDSLLDRARELAREILDNTAPVSNALSRQMMWRMMGADHPMEAHKIDSRAIQSRGRSNDAQEGISAFFEKRPAKFPDTFEEDMPEFYPWWDDRKFS